MLNNIEHHRDKVFGNINLDEKTENFPGICFHKLIIDKLKRTPEGTKVEFNILKTGNIPSSNTVLMKIGDNADLFDKTLNRIFDHHQAHEKADPIKIILTNSKLPKELRFKHYEESLFILFIIKYFSRYFIKNNIINK